ncbi:MAG: hypothetical protein CI947_2119, partial [Halanaerobium sp.]
MAVLGRNDTCPCGSGEKYKKCCIDKEKLNFEDPKKSIYLELSLIHISEPTRK